MTSSAKGVIKRLWALECGYLHDDRSKLAVGESGPVRVPCAAYLLEHDRGLVLVDTGLVPEAVQDMKGVYGAMGDELSIEFSDAQRVDRQIEALGFTTADIDYVLMSHLHWDHTGGMSLFPKAKFYVMSGELQYAYWPLPAAPLFRREDIEPTRGFDWTEIEGQKLDFFGDGSLIVLLLPGHTPGNASLIVRLASQTIILAMDTAHVRSGLEGDRPMPSDWNTLEAVRSIRKLKQIAHGLNATIWVLHDPDDWASIKHAPEFYS